VSRRRFALSRKAPFRKPPSRKVLSRVAQLLGLAGLAGVAATGAVVARAERRRRAATPDEIRARLRERAAAAQARSSEPPGR
jgi:hypothetical protein